MRKGTQIMKKPLIIAAICGIAIVVGVIVYLSNEKKKKADEKEQQPEVKKPEEESQVSYVDLNDMKSNTASTISERHTVAAQIIRETLSEENNETGESEHKVDFDEIDSSLDSLLDEE